MKKLVRARNKNRSPSGMTERKASSKGLVAGPGNESILSGG
jgi:hypothetical protein